MDIKKDLDTAIDSSGDSDEKLTDNLVLLHNKYYGKQKTNELIDTLYDDKDSTLLQEQIVNDIKNFNMKDANNKVANEIYKQTPEGKYLQPLYDVADPLLKAASVVEKPASIAVSAGRTLGKGANALLNAINSDYGVPFDGEIPLVKELYDSEKEGGIWDKINIAPTQEGSLTADLRENFPQEGFLKGVLPEGMKKAFPKASAAIEGIGPYEVADIGVATALPKAIKLGAAGSLESSIQDSFNNTKKALIRMSDGLSEPNKLRLNKNLDRIAQRVLDEPELLKRLGNAEEMEKYLLGEATGRRTKHGALTQATKSVGALEEAANDIKNAIGKYGNVSFNHPKMMQGNISKRVLKRVKELGSGVEHDVSSILRETEKFMKTNSFNNYSVEDLIDMKRKVSKRLFDLGKSSFDPSSPSALNHMVAEEIWSEIDRQIRKVVKTTGDTSITDANARFNDLASIKDIMGSTVTKRLKTPSLKESLIGGSAMAFGAMGAGMSPWQASLLGGIYPVGRAVERGMAESFPSYSARASKIAQKGYGVMSNLPTAPLAVTLASYEIPRNTAQIMKERDLVLAKLAQETNTPEGQVLFDAIHDALMNNPHKVQGLMKVLSDNYPQIFAQDKYQKFDGIVPVQNRKAALKDLNNSKKYSNGQKADKIQRLINEGYLDEY